MYTLVFKFKGADGCVFDVYHTNEQGRQRIVGNIYCYFNFGTGKLHNTHRTILDDGKKQDMLDFHTVGSSKECEIPEKTKMELYRRAEMIFGEIKGMMF